MTQVFEASKPEIVFHAPAHKHVPMMEWNPGEAVKNNVAERARWRRSPIGMASRGSARVDRQGRQPDVRDGCDQAGRRDLPAGFLGELADAVVTVRFGNVLGSAGSVIPIFRQQIAKGGPVLVTHPEMRRYFMTIPERASS